MKVLLIATNQAGRYMDRMAVRPLPVGLAYVAAHINTARHPLQVLDLMFSEDAHTDVTQAVQRFQPEVIGLSLRNLDNQSYLNPVWHLPTVRALIDHLRSLSPATIVCGGPAFSILPEACFAYLSPDLGMAGDAAESFARLVDCLAQGESCTDLPGVVYRHHGDVVVNPEHFTTDFHVSPRLDLLDIRRYDKAGFGIGVVNKLAPYYYATADGKGQTQGEGPDGPAPTPSRQDWRIRPVEEIVAELRWLQRDCGIRKVFFIDSGFNVPLPRAKELCQALIGADLGLRWNSYMRPGTGDAELIELMQRSGCSLALLAGADGANVEHVDLGERLDRVRQFTTLCAQGDLPFTLAMNFGNPGETRATVEHKVAFLRETAPAFATLRVGTRVLPHTHVARTALEEGLITAEADLLQPTFYLATGVRDWLVEYLRTAAATQPRWHLM